MAHEYNSKGESPGGLVRLLLMILIQVWIVASSVTPDPRPFFLDCWSSKSLSIKFWSFHEQSAWAPAHSKTPKIVVRARGIALRTRDISEIDHPLLGT